MHIEYDTVSYAVHSMMHRAVVQMDPTKLEMLDGYERVDAGHIFSPEGTNVRVRISGRNWEEKRLLIYGSTSSEEARRYVEQVVDDLEAIGHEATPVHDPEITNLAVSGDFGIPLSLESLFWSLDGQEVDVEYEPEQFPAAIVRLGEPEATFMLYSTGKFVIQGLTELIAVDEAVEKMVAVLNSTE